MSKRKKLVQPSTFRRTALAFLAARGVHFEQHGLKNKLLVGAVLKSLDIASRGSNQQNYLRAMEGMKGLPLTPTQPTAYPGKRPRPIGKWNPQPFDADHVVIPLTPTQKQIDDFYASWEWKRLRYDFIKDKDRRCGCCGASPSDGIRIVCDHIKPIRRFWGLRLDAKNLQLLCDDCNMGKGSRDTTDWRASAGD